MPKPPSAFAFACRGLLAIALVLQLVGPPATTAARPNHQFDVNRDGQVTPSDAIAIIAYLNRDPCRLQRDLEQQNAQHRCHERCRMEQ